MSHFSRFFPFLRPHLSQMVLAGVLIMGVAALNLILLRLAGRLWDIVTVQRDVALMTQTILIFLGLAVLQSTMAMGQSYLTTRLSQHVIADFRRHLFRHLHRLSLSFFARRRTRRNPVPAHERHWRDSKPRDRKRPSIPPNRW